MNKKKFPIVIQSELFECGLACIAAIAESKNLATSLEKLRNKFEITSSGLTLLHLINISASVGLISRAVRLDLTEIDQLKLPSILTWNHQHFVVLVSIRGNTVQIMDPAVGMQFFQKSELSSYFSGTALEVIGTQANSVKKADVVESNVKTKIDSEFEFSFPVFLKTFTKYKSYLFPLIIYSCILQIFALVSPKFISLTLDEVLQKNDLDFLTVLIFIFGFVFFLQVLFSFLKNKIIMQLRADLVVEHGAKFIHALFAMPLRYFAKRSAANILRRSRSIDYVHYIYTHGYIDLAIGGISLIAFSALMINLNMLMGIFMILMVLILFTSRLLAIPFFKSLMLSSIDREVSRDFQLFETINSISNFKLNGGLALKASNWVGEHAETIGFKVRLENLGNKFTIFTSALSSLENLTIIYLGSNAVIEGNLTVGSLIAFLFYKDQFMGCASSIVNTHIGLQIAQIETQRLHEVKSDGIQNKPEFKHSLVQKLDFDRLTVTNLTFGYTSLDKPILENINFEISKNEKVFISGKSGGGKSTLLSLLSGLYKPNTGYITVNNLSIDNLGSAYSSLIAVCSSTDEIMNGSVVDNIVCGEIDVDVDRLEKSIYSSGFDTVIYQLSQGLNTRLGTSGTKLSSGQRQRLLLARALYSEPQLLILDEPTAHLDREVADLIIEKIASLKIAVLIVTHDSAIHKVCDRGFILKDSTLISCLD